MNFFFFFSNKQTNWTFLLHLVFSSLNCSLCHLNHSFFSPSRRNAQLEDDNSFSPFFPLAPCRTYFFFVLPLTATSPLSINSLFSCVRTGGMRSWFSFLDGVQRGWFTALELSNWTKEKGLRFIFRIQGVSVLSLRFDIFHSEPKFLEVWIIRWIADGIISRSPWLGA